MLRLAVHGIWTLLLLVQPSTNSAYCSLETVVAERPNCPKFVTIKMSDAKLSLGDEMIHLYTLLAAACHLGRTAVLPDTFRIVSSETSDFHYIGIPIHTFQRMAGITSDHVLTQSELSYGRLIHQTVHAIETQRLEDCNTIVEVSMDGCYQGGNCFSEFSNRIRTLIYPVLQEMIQLREHSSSRGGQLAQPSATINVVWHIHAESSHSEDYFRNVLGYMQKHLLKLSYSITVIGESGAASPELSEALAFLKDKEKVHFAGALSVLETIDALLGCDVLFYTGGSLPLALGWASELDRPIVLEAAVAPPSLSTAYLLPDGRSIRLNETGLPLFDLAKHDAYIEDRLADVGRLIHL